MVSPRPRVLQVAAADYAAYHILLPLLEGLSGEFDVTMACSPGPDLNRVAAKGIQVHPIPIPRTLRTLSHLPALYRLARYMREGKFDLVHTHTPMASLIARPAARLAGVPVTVYTAHGFYFHDRMNPLGFRTHVQVERLLGRMTDHLITVSREDAQTAVREHIIPESRITWIPNGIDLGRFNPEDPAHLQRVVNLRGEFGLRLGQPVVGIVGRMVREKGFFDFVEAARAVVDRYPDAVMLCIGDALPSDRENPLEALRGRAKELGLERNVLFPGFRKDVVDFLGMMDVLALPSYREGLPLSVLEAMAMGKPSVVTNIRGCRELIADGIYGRVIEPGAPKQLADAILFLLDRPEQAKAMGQAAREHVREHYALDLYLSRHRNLYRKLLGQEHKRRDSHG